MGWVLFQAKQSTVHGTGPGLSIQDGEVSRALMPLPWLEMNGSL